MRTALLVLNPREIPDCIQAIKSLDLPTCWLSYMPETHAVIAANAAIASTTFDRYLVLSDDTTPTRDAVTAVLKLHDEGHPVVTGYCNLDSVLPLVNLTTNVLPPPPPTIASYEFITREDAEAQEVTRTTFAGMSLTLLSRDWLTEHPLQTSLHGGQVDYMLSYELAQYGVPIVAPRAGFIHHVKERWNMLDQAKAKRLLVGARPPAVTWT